MADDTPPIAKRNVAVSIGVAETGGFPFLSGAINAAKAFYGWADALKYQSHLVTDETSPVTFSRMRFEIEAALAGATSPPLKQDDERRVIDAALSRAKPIRRLFFLRRTWAYQGNGTGTLVSFGIRFPNNASWMQND